MASAISNLPFRGTILNTLTVAVGATVGLLIGQELPDKYKEIALIGIALVNLGMGVKLFLETKNVLIPTIAILIGGLLGTLLSIDAGVAAIAEQMRRALGGDGDFNVGLITASVLFCVGPMTLLGCIKDGLNRDIELLAVKSVFDMIAAVMFAAALGTGVLASAVVVLVVQGLLTALAKPLRPLVEKPQLASEASAAGGLILIAIGLSVMGLKKISTELFLPALVIAPLVAPLLLKKDQLIAPSTDS